MGYKTRDWLTIYTVTHILWHSVSGTDRRFLLDKAETDFIIKMERGKDFSGKLNNFFIILFLVGGISAGFPPDVDIMGISSFNKYFRVQGPPDVSTQSTVEHLQSQLSPNSKYPSVPDLTTIIASFGEQNCFILINNFQGINLPGDLNHPILSRQPQPALFWRRQRDLPSPSIFSYDMVWVPSYFKIGRSSETGMNCSISKFFPEQLRIFKRRPTKFRDLCLRPDLFSLSAHSKPWNCQVQIGLFPSPYIQKDGIKYPQTFQYFVDPAINKFSLLRFTFPSLISSVNLFVVNDTYLESIKFNDLLWGSIFANLIQSDPRGQINGPLAAHAIFLIAKVSLLTPIMISNSTLEHHSKIDSISLVKLGTHFETSFDSEFIQRITLKADSDLKSISRLNNLLYPNFGKELTAFNFVEEERNTNLLRYVFIHLKHCKNYISNGNFLSEGGLPFEASTEKLAHAYAHLWIEIMQNYTLQLDKIGTDCENGELKHYSNIFWRSMYSKDLIVNVKTNLFISENPQLNPLNFKDQLNSLRFITCGLKGYKGFVSARVARVFDTTVRLGIFVSPLILIVALKYLHEASAWVDPNNEDGLHYPYWLHSSLFSYFLTIYASVFEQSSPFLRSLSKVQRLRWIIGAVLLVLLVISNTYKNTHIFNMISPSKPVPYETIRELISAGFTIYSRTNYINFKMTWFWNGEPQILLNDTNNGHRIVEAKLTRFGLWSEIHSLHLRLRSRVRIEHLNLESDSSKKLSELHQNTRLHSETKQILLQFACNTSILNSYKSGERLDIQFWNEEKIILFSELAQCDKTALVLPEYVCNEFASMLQRPKEGGNAHLSSQFINIGKENYADIYLSFSLSGLVPPIMIERIKGTISGGLWDWWMKFIKTTRSSEQQIDIANFMTPFPISLKEKSGSELYGNITVYFAAWLCGLALASTAFLAEKRSILTNYLKFVWRIVNNSVSFCSMELTIIILSLRFYYWKFCKRRITRFK